MPKKHSYFIETLCKMKARTKQYNFDKGHYFDQR